MRKIRKITAVLLASLMLLTGCGRKAKEAPELLDPVATNEAYRTVEYGNVGDYKLYYGIIVPTDYCQFYSTATNIKEIKVKVGDYVNKGDVLATADVESISKQIAEINESLDTQNKYYALEDEKYDISLAYIKDQYAYANANGETEMANELNKEIAIMEENHSYDVLMREKKKKSVAADINELQSLMTDGRLVADASGYVSYVKDMSEGTYVSNSENVVIISDMNDRYISVVGATVDQDILKNANLVCTYEGDKRIMLEELAYSGEAVFSAENKKIKLPLKMKYGEGASIPEIGSTIPIYVSKNVVENVLIVGNDSVVEDEDGFLVYVKNGDGKEARRIELGVRDDNYSEVVSGLAEGDEVYYISDKAIISDYVEYTVEKSDYSQVLELNDRNYSVINTKSTYYYSEYEGRVTELKVSKGDTVSKGDLICKIDTNQGSAYLVELKKSIENTKEAHTKTVDSNDKKKKELEALLPSLEATSDEYKETKYELDLLKVDIEIEELQYTSSLAFMQKQYDEAMKNNDGKGVMSVYATKDGIIKNVPVTEGKYITAGTMIAQASEEGDKQLVISSDKLPPAINATITIHNTHTDEKYEGTMYGIRSNDTYYVTTRNDRVCITSNGNSTPGGYIDIIDEQVLNSLQSCKIIYKVAEIKDVIVLSRDYVHVEEDAIKVKDNKKYYVWKINDGKVVKQYISVAPTLVSDMKNYYVISGLSVGDIIAGEAD